jgi:hypothetical protein
MQLKSPELENLVQRISPNPANLEGQTVQEKLIEITEGGLDYTFDCTEYIFKYLYIV